MTCDRKLIIAERKKNVAESVPSLWVPTEETQKVSVVSALLKLMLWCHKPHCSLGAMQTCC